ncbi:MDR family MFS transporter [Actinoplanes sp. N902-109]|uniref:MDR family MFS transporter n=1 Tax=Actinoplanes sp. (strain N902-109) TaxID=649831 RepID=UPI0003295C41|nr:MDR family MFS transporter [Actinoplanes sp. N902-109]AGL15961.1 drug resistance transporter EmrB/QacA subfamily [Actinoplanes sp. N902-109]
MSNATSGSRPPAPEPQQDGMSRRATMIVLSGLMLCLFLSTLDQTIVATALYQILTDIGGAEGLGQASWLVTAYLITSTATTPLYGKLSDLYGRKRVYLVAIALFMIGSALCGLAQNLPELITFRALQGVGGGGLTSLAFVVIGDLFSPRERGKFMGYIYGVFMLGTAAGPLIGGVFADHDTVLGADGWRWIFYANVPFGVAALALIIGFLRLPATRREHRIDFLGALLVAGGATTLILGAAMGGREYSWDSPVIIGLFAASLVQVAIFIWWERRAAEPVMSMKLWNNSIFSVTNALALIIGVASTGVLTFLALFLQVVNGDSPTEAGISLLPLMIGLLATSIITGRLITRTGRYKIFPIIGTAIALAGMILLASLDENTTVLARDLYLALIGIGMGLVMQVLTVAVQNSVERKDMGAATSANPFFRAMGGAVGTAVFGAILASRVSSYVTSELGTDRLPDGSGTSTVPAPSVVHGWPANVQGIFTDAFVHAMSIVCWTAAGFLTVAFVLTWLLKEVPLRTAAPAAQAAKAAPAAAVAPAK